MGADVTIDNGEAEVDMRFRRVSTLSIVILRATCIRFAWTSGWTIIELTWTCVGSAWASFCMICLFSLALLLTSIWGLINITVV